MQATLTHPLNSIIALAIPMGKLRSVPTNSQIRMVWDMVWGAYGGGGNFQKIVEGTLYMLTSVHFLAIIPSCTSAQVNPEVPQLSGTIFQKQPIHFLSAVVKGVPQ